MKTFAVKEKRAAPMLRRASRPAIQSVGPVQHAQRSEVHNILHSTGAQAKLTVGAPNDKYEQEANRVADRVMRMSDTDVAQRVETGRIQPMQIQRMCPECEEEQGLQRQPIEEEEEELQAKEMLGHTPQVSSNLESRINNLKGGGKPLDSISRSFFEPRFGNDFSGVRVHADSNASETAKSINARAFTLGNHVVMGSGEYQPQSKEGKRLLGHELTHVVQQGEGRTGGKAKKLESIESDPIDMSTTAPSGLLQRWSYGAGASPHSDYVKVPAGDKKRVDAAMAIVGKMANDKKSYPSCHKFFKDKCPGGKDETYKDVYDNAKMWKDTDADPTLLGSSVDPKHIAYTNKSYGVGRWAVAASMIHELIHNCGVASHVIGDNAKAACGKLPNI